MGYVYMVLGLIAVSIGTAALKLSDGMRKPVPAAIVAAGGGIGIWMLGWSLATLPLGPVFAIWSGSNIVLTKLVGVVLFKETVDPRSLLATALIVVGAAMTQLGSQAAQGGAP